MKPCGGTFDNGPEKRFVRCRRCGCIDFERNEGDICTRPMPESQDATPAARTVNLFAEVAPRQYSLFDVSEADEGASSDVQAIANLVDQVQRGESPAIVDMYERAAWRAGASVADTEAAIRRARR